ncbi:Hypothetical protein SCF082_LOCUS5315 [Durusdinium trenchii]|uniref:Uncharacterized protein n=1 Tax=Durusdinium trenchii TaxID=1381693 RepID=A0ABP0I7W6_9DINO
MLAGGTETDFPSVPTKLRKSSQVTGQDLCNNPDFVCNTAENGFVTAIGYWMKNCQEWDASHTFDAALAAIRPANTQANPERRASFYEWLKALGISPVTTTPKPPMPDEGETQVKAGEGCWQIADRCCDGQGADYATVICDPPACSPGPSAGTTIKYNCKGCN